MTLSYTELVALKAAQFSIGKPVRVKMRKVPEAFSDAYIEEIEGAMYHVAIPFEGRRLHMKVPITELRSAS